MEWNSLYNFGNRHFEDPNIFLWSYLSQCMRFPTTWYVPPAKPQISLRICAVWSECLLVAWVIYDCLATDWIPFGVSKLKRRLQRLVRVYTCQNSNCWKSHAAAHFIQKDNPLLANLGKDFLYASVHHQCHQYILTDKRNAIGKIQSHVTSMFIH